MQNTDAVAFPEFDRELCKFPQTRARYPEPDPALYLSHGRLPERGEGRGVPRAGERGHRGRLGRLRPLQQGHLPPLHRLLRHRLHEAVLRRAHRL